MNVHGFILPSRIFGLLFLLFTLILLGIAAWLYFRTTDFLAEAETAQGQIVEMKRSSGGDSITYQPVFTFIDSAGEQHRIVSSWSSNPPGYSIGESVEVLYRPNDPQDARIRSFTTLWLLPAIFAGTSIGPLFGSVLFIWFIPFIIRRVWPSQEGGQPPSSTAV